MGTPHSPLHSKDPLKASETGHSTMRCYFIAKVASYVPQVACTATSRWRQEAAALGTLSAVNTGEINANRLALAQATAAGPKRLAQRMIDAHTCNSQQVATWRADASAPPARAEMDEGK